MADKDATVRDEEDAAAGADDNGHVAEGEIELAPVADRILMVLDDSETKTKSGIFIPAAAQKKSRTGRAVAVGPGPRSPFTGTYADMGIRPGDELVIAELAGNELEVNGISMLAIRETDVIMIVRRSQPTPETDAGLEPETS